MVPEGEFEILTLVFGSEAVALEGELETVVPVCAFESTYSAQLFQDTFDSYNALDFQRSKLFLYHIVTLIS